MPKISIPIKSGYLAESVMNMAEQLAKMTGTAVECQAVIEVTAAEPVIKALAVLAPMAKKKYQKRHEPMEETGSADQILEETSP
jgi:hypothetical protein